MEQVIVQAPQQIQYSSVMRRWVAAFVDGLVLAGVDMVIGLGLGNYPAAAQIAVVLVGISYYVYFIGRWGQTLGKKWLRIKVQTKDGAVPGFKKALIRETVGKLVSGLVLGVGYLWAIWDKDKQTWHDKLAGTVVVRVWA